MRKIDKNTYGSALFELRWQSPSVRHTDRFVAQKINLWRDILPREIHCRLEGLAAGERADCGRACLERDPGLVREHPLRGFHPERQGLPGLLPRPGRFYPQGLLDNVLGVHPSNMRPFRVLETSENAFLADRNHPLAGVPYELSVEATEVRDKVSELGGSCQEWLEPVLDGPGMQARRPGGAATAFFDDAPLAREDESPDAAFHVSPRMVAHVDSMARSRLRALHGALLRPGMDVLDLMAGLHSHLPEGLELSRRTGLGMNREEMDANPDLREAVVHDLNQDPVLPFAPGSFDAVLCALSAEYLTRPLDVVREAARVLRPGGVLCLSVSNRWHAPKVTRLWVQLHEFERLGFLADLLLRAGAFDEVQTLSERGWPRPYDDRDRYYPVLQNADPIYAAWGVRS